MKYKFDKRSIYLTDNNCFSRTERQKSTVPPKTCEKYEIALK